MIVADSNALLALLNRREPVYEAADVVRRYADQQVGAADASLVVLAERYRTRRVPTLDRRHFETQRPLQQGRFQLLPLR